MFTIAIVLPLTLVQLTNCGVSIPLGLIMHLNLHHMLQCVKYVFLYASLVLHNGGREYGSGEMLIISGECTCIDVIY